MKVFWLRVSIAVRTPLDTMENFAQWVTLGIPYEANFGHIELDGETDESPLKGLP